MPLGLTGHLLHKTTLPRPGDIADPPNTWKQAQETAKMGRQSNTSPMKEQNSRTKTRAVPEAESKTRVIGVLSDLGGRIGDHRTSTKIGNIKKEIEIIKGTGQKWRMQ